MIGSEEVDGTGKSADELDAELLHDWDAWSETTEARETVTPFLVHVSGTDDVFPARTGLEAVVAAQAINVGFVWYARRCADTTIHPWATPYPRLIAVELRIAPDLGPVA